jgi:hypothetical protein
VSSNGLRTVSFGDLEAGLWGSVRIPDAGAAILASLFAGGEVTHAEVSASVGDSGPDTEWRLSGPGLELVVSPIGELAELSEADAALSGSEQRCRVTGTMSREGAEQPVDCLGRRGRRSEPDWSRFESVREVAAWFGSDDAFVLVAARPQGAKGHASDLVAALTFDEGTAAPVAEPRLSTTYDRDGMPVSASLELWLDDEESSFPRRAAGEAVIRPAAPDWIPFRWHGRPGEGAGSYELRRR